MIHVVTCHFRSDRWIEVQLDYLRRTMGEPYEVWASLEGEEAERHAGRFDHVVPSIGKHAAKLNLIAAEICHVAPPDDLLVFLDGDAFPVADPMPVVREALSRTDLVAVRQAENMDEPQPHPCFAAVTVGTWRDIGGEWTGAHPWRGPNGRLVTDVGGNLLRLLELHGRTWTPLLRTNKVDDHPVWYGVYAGVVYHHGAGFRLRYSWADIDEHAPTPWLPGLAERRLAGAPVRRVNHLRRRRRAAQLSQRSMARSEELFEEIRTNPKFYLQFL